MLALIETTRIEQEVSIVHRLRDKEPELSDLDDESVLRLYTNSVSIHQGRMQKSGALLFLQYLDQLQKDYNQIRKTNSEKAFTLTPEQQTEFDATLFCYCCKRAFNAENGGNGKLLGWMKKNVAMWRGDRGRRDSNWWRVVGAIRDLNDRGEFFGSVESVRDVFGVG